MKIYVFGNPDQQPDQQIDNAALLAAHRLQKSMPEIHFVFVSPNEDLPFQGDVVLMDVVLDLAEPRLIDGNLPDALMLAPRTSVHDHDLAFQLKYLKKLGKLGKVSLIGIPPTSPPDYKRIQSILRKLVAQDMQGS